MKAALDKGPERATACAFHPTPLSFPFLEHIPFVSNTYLTFFFFNFYKAFRRLLILPFARLLPTPTPTACAYFK